MTVQTDLYDGMLSDIIALTNRPDLVTETDFALRTATLSVHHSQAFPLDVALAEVVLTVESYLVSLDRFILFPRIRGLSTVRICGADLEPIVAPEITIVELGDIYDPIYRTLKNNICYLAGAAVNVKTSVPAAAFLIEYLRSPQIQRAVYDSWIAVESPPVIVYSAAAIVLATNGNEEKAKSYREMVKGTLQPELVSNFLTSAIR